MRRKVLLSFAVSQIKNFSLSFITVPRSPQESRAKFQIFFLIFETSEGNKIGFIERTLNPKPLNTRQGWRALSFHQFPVMFHRLFIDIEIVSRTFAALG
jgi:hypothetical protein